MYAYLISSDSSNFEELSDPNKIGKVLLVDANLSQVHKVQDGFKNALFDTIHKENGMRARIVLYGNRKDF